MNAMPEYDYSADKDDLPLGDNLMARLSGLAAEQMQAEARVAQLDEDILVANEELRHIKENLLPTLMEEAEVEEFTTRDGVRIEMKEALRGSISKAKQAEAFAWLEEHNHGRIIKRQLTIDFGKEEEDWAKKFERDCAQRKKPLNMKRRKMVAPPTLLAFLKGQLEQGVPIPLDMFGVFRQRFAKVTIKT